MLRNTPRVCVDGSLALLRVEFLTVTTTTHTASLLRRLNGWMTMADSEMMTLINDALHDLLVWVGFGTLVGLTAKAVMPGRDPGGAITTLIMGIGGSVIGCGLMMYFFDTYRVTPVSPVGFAVATGGAFILLIFYRLFSGSFFLEAEDGIVGPRRKVWAFRRKRRR